MRRVADPQATPVGNLPVRPGLAGFKSERWPASFRNGGRHQIGMPGRNASEFANVDLDSSFIGGGTSYGRKLVTA
jgi:hypothetical protein